MRFLWFIIGLVIGGYAIHVYDQHEYGSARNVAGQVGDRLSQDIQKWHLTPNDIRGDIARTGDVVRSKAHVAGDRLDDARIVTTIKAKYVLDSDLSALDIHVESHDGNVVLTGTVASPGLIGRATALALETGGVRSVRARLGIKS
ncbi:MAG: BON domain-containing protein [Opitutaceae bacterium]